MYLFVKCVSILHITYICYMLCDVTFYITYYILYILVGMPVQTRPLSKAAGTGSHDSGSHTKRMVRTA